MTAALSYWPEPDTSLWPDESRRLHLVAPSHWRDWLTELFPAHVRAGFGERHAMFWDWLWAITPASDPAPFVGIWPRGGAKTSSVELGAAALGTRGMRRYGLYIRDTQDRADDSVQNIGALLESGAIDRYYPEHGQRLVGKHGNSKGWRRNRLRTGGGFTIDALGLDVAGRGVKLEDTRPDFLIFDDIDSRHDTAAATEKKLETIKESLLPAGTANAAIIAIQNLIIPNGVFARLADGRADFLARRVVSGPDPAVRGLTTRQEPDAATGRTRTIVTGGRPTWAGQGLPQVQQLIDRIGLTSFNRECQHQVHEREGALWTRDVLTRGRVDALPRLKRAVIAVDPSGGGDEIGIIGAGLGYDGHGYVFRDATAKGALGPLHWGREAVALYDDHDADLIVAEKNFGGDMVESNIRVAGGARRVNVKMVHASRGKDVRAEPVAALYSDGLVHHVGEFPELETEYTSWVPGDPESPNRLDAAVWALTELMLHAPAAKQQPRRSRSYVTL